MKRLDPIYFKYSKSQKNWFLGFFVSEGKVAIDYNLTMVISPAVMRKDAPPDYNIRRLKSLGMKEGDYVYFSKYVDFLPRHECNIIGFNQHFFVCKCLEEWPFVKKPSLA